ncbi:membrane protein insertion efficiency factor YidD [Ramlibacter aquaticus]
MRALLLALIRAYTLTFGAWMRPSCRFAPSCSVYARQAVQRHGAAWGSALTLHRLARCGPWCQGGDDPVPVERPRLFSRLVEPSSKNNS